MKNPATCPQCGGPHVGGLTCWEQFGQLLAWAAQDPDLLAEHFLTVASYNLQHPAQFTNEALAGLRAALIAYLDEGVSVKEIRRRVGREAKGPTRVLKPEAERRPVLRQWPMTIADVHLSGQSEGAAARVRAWAESVRRGLEPTPPPATLPD